jgi:hypothetical protein
VQVFDGVNKKMSNANVLVKGNLIKQVATVIVGGGRTLMPDLMKS